MQLNPHYAELNESYLFSTIAHKVADYQKAHPEADVIRLGIGDVTLPLAASVTEAMHKAVEEQGHKGTFHGYIPSEQGYEFLRDAIRRYYAGHGVELDMSEIFISDGAKSDLGNLLDLFSQDNTILVPDPVYPVYVDTNVMAGRKIIFAEHYDEHREFWRRELTDYLETCREEQLLLPEIDAPAFAEQLMSTILDLRLNGTVREELRLFCRTILRGAATRKGIELIDRKP